MWAAQHFPFDEPNRWMTSGGLGTMGYGLPAAIGAQMAHPKSLVIDIAGEASILMNIQEMSTAIQYRLPVKIFILNNQYMGMVRQWQELLHGGRYSESYTDSLPDFVKLAEAYGAHGIRCSDPADLDRAILEMIDSPKAGDLRLHGRSEGKLLPDDPVGQGAQRNDSRRSRATTPGVDIGSVIDEKGKMLVLMPVLGEERPRFDGTPLRERARQNRTVSGDIDHMALESVTLPMKAPASYPPSPYSSPIGKTNAESHTLSVLVDNEPGVLARVVGLFSARSFNIESLTVAEVAHETHLSRITVVTSGTPEVIDQVRHQLERLVPVHSVTDLTLTFAPSSANSRWSRCAARATRGSRRCNLPRRSAPR